MMHDPCLVRVFVPASVINLVWPHPQGGIYDDGRHEGTSDFQVNVCAVDNEISVAFCMPVGSRRAGEKVRTAST